MVPHALALTALVATFLPAHAQTAANRSPLADPLLAQAAVPATVYHSTLSGFRTNGQDVPLPWREANDRVRSIGGWRVYAREAQQTPAKPATAVPPPVPAAGAQQEQTR